MSRRKRELTAEEKQLWFRVGETVKRQRKQLRAPVGSALAAPVGTRPSALAPRVDDLNPTSLHLKNRDAALAERGNEKRVRRGKLEIGASLDLHGHSQISGRHALERFLLAASRRGDRVVIVVTGVGRGGEGVLKRRLPDWLTEPALRAVVSGFAPAHRKHGGAGAWYVFLKRRSDQ